MTYKIDPNFKRNVEKEKSNIEKNECIQSIKDLIDSLQGKGDKFNNMKLKEFTFTIKCDE